MDLTTSLRRGIMFYEACRRECSQNDIKKRVHAPRGRCKGGAVKLLRGGDPGDPQGILGGSMTFQGILVCGTSKCIAFMTFLKGILRMRLPFV